jgi:hypothetical protein
MYCGFIRTGVAMAVLATGTVGWISAGFPAEAAPAIPLVPPPCAQFSFGFTTFLLDGSIPLTFSGDGPHVDSTANLPTVQGVAQQAHIVGDVDQHGHIDLVTTAVGGGGTSTRYTGDVAPDGNASGTFTGPGTVTGSWHTQFPLKCTQQAAPPPPANAIVVNTHQALTNVSFDVRNTSTTPGDCRYDANPTNNPLLPPVHRDFHLDAAPAKGSSTQLDFLAPPLGATYHVVISCGAQGQEIGHFEQDVTGSI